MTEDPIPTAPPARRGSFAVKLLILLGVLVLALAVLWWWTNRPIRPVELTSKEMAAVKAKVEAISRPMIPAEPEYLEGSREIILTERELNGLLNERTTLGESLRFELATDAIHARVETDLDPDLPVVGGKRLKARARFLLSRLPEPPAFILDDLTVWGISLPNDWLAGLKGKDLLTELLGGGTPGTISGIEEIKVEPGRIVIRLEE